MVINDPGYICSVSMTSLTEIIMLTLLWTNFNQALQKKLSN